VNQCLEGGAKTQYGAPEFWLRYFSPFNDTPFNVSQSNAVAECDAIWDCGAEHLGPICDPVSLESTSADGMGVAQTFCAALLQTAKWVDQLKLPTNLYCWLDQEVQEPMSAAFWSGWWNYLNSYSWGGVYPLYPCIYCNPCNFSYYGTHKTTEAACYVTATVPPYAVWSCEVDEGNCTKYTLTNPPATFQGTTCGSCVPANQATTQLWQFNENCPCVYESTDYPVDMDVGAPGFNTENYCWSLTSRP
jgi:hypothetical protein